MFITSERLKNKEDNSRFYRDFRCSSLRILKDASYFFFLLIILYCNYENPKFIQTSLKTIIHVYWKNVIGIIVLQKRKEKKKDFSMLSTLFSTLMDNIFQNEIFPVLSSFLL